MDTPSSNPPQDKDSKAQSSALVEFFKQVWMITFRPDVNSTVYLTRKRMQIAMLATFIFDIVFGFVWTELMPQQGLEYWVFVALGLLALAAFFNLRYRFIPYFSQLTVVVISLWANIPFLAFYNYYSSGNSLGLFAGGAIMLLLYSNIHEWRSSLLGIILAAMIAAFWAYMAHGALHAPPLMHLIIFGAGLLGAVVVAMSNADVNNLRASYANKVISVSERQFQPMIEKQMQLIQALRYEAQTIIQDPKLRHYLEMMAGSLEDHVNQLNQSITRLRMTAEQSAELGANRTLWMSHVLLASMVELNNIYHLEPQMVEEYVKLDVQSDFLMDADLTELSHAFAALLYAMLTPTPDGIDTGRLHQPKLIITSQRKSHVGLITISAPSTPGGFGQNVQSVLPPFTVYVFKRLEIRREIKDLRPDGIPTQIDLICQQPSHSGKPNA